MKLLELIHAAHNPELAKTDGSVYQIWQDGEITLQKSGELLWHRNLHCMDSGFYTGLSGHQMPAQWGQNGYAFVTREDAYKIRQAMQVDAVAVSN